jgi:hypothetical protein
MAIAVGFPSGDTLDARQAAGAIQPIEDELIPRTAPTELPARVEVPVQVPSIAQGTVICLAGERDMIDAAYRDLNTVVSSRLFRDKVLETAFTETRDLTNQEIYALLIRKSPIAVSFTMFTGGFRQNHIWHTVGFEDVDHPDVCFANRYFVAGKEVCASLILHETMHLLGFRHDGNKVRSVPYTMNRIYDAVATALHLGL